MKRGKSQRDVALDFGIAQQVISKWIRKFDSTGSMLNSPKLGRPRKTNTYEDRAIIRASKADPLKTAVGIVTDFNKNKAITLNQISVSTVKGISDVLGYLEDAPARNLSYLRRIGWPD